MKLNVLIATLQSLAKLYGDLAVYRLGDNERVEVALVGVYEEDGEQRVELD